MNNELTRELDGLSNDRKMTNLAVDSKKREIADMLSSGGVGYDMKEVLSGRRKIEVPKKERVKFKINSFQSILRLELMERALAILHLN